MRVSLRTLVPSWPHGRRVIVRSLTLTTCLTSLAGCATKPPAPSVSCPEPVPIPAALAASSLPEVRSLSLEVRSFLADAETWLKGLQSTKTP